MGRLSSDDDDDVEDEEYPPEELKQVVVDYLKNLDKDGFIRMLRLLPANNKLAVEPILQPLLNDETNKEECLRAIIQFLSDDYEKGTPLHYAAWSGAHEFTAVLLRHGEDPNVRVDVWKDHLKQALPLNVALHSLAWLVANDVEIDLERKFSSFRLVCELCSTGLRSFLETVRLLALQTEDLSREIRKYVYEGKVVELCALMLVGYHKKVPSAFFIEGDKRTKEAIQTFERIGDKLQSYVKLKPPESRNRMVSDIGSIFRDAGLPVKNKDSWIYSGIYNAYSLRNGKGELVSQNNGLNNLGGIGYSHMARDVTQGSCSFHTSSVLKARRGRAQSSPLLKGVWWNPSFLMMAFRRATKHV